MARAVLACLVLLALPAAHASTVAVEFSSSFGTATLHAEGILAGGEAEGVRSLIDRSGDRDGTVTAAEVERFVSQYRSLVGAQVSQFAANLSLDGRRPVGFETGDLAMQGAEGPVAGGAPIDFQLGMTFLFEPVEGPTHVLRLRGERVPGGDILLTVHAPPGWRLAEALPGAALDADARQATATVPTNGTEMQFRFESTRSAPGIAAAPLVVVALLAARRARP